MTLFGTAGIRGPVSEEVTPELALAVGRAVGASVRGESETISGDGAPVVVGRDGRLTSPALAAAVAAGLQSTGVRVVRVGVVPTPALAFASRDRHGVMITASHNPPGDNGLKLFADGREYDRAAEQTIARAVEAGGGGVAWDQWAGEEAGTPIPDYLTAVTAFARRHGASLSGHRLVVDCGNGTGGLATPQVLRALGAEVITLNANVDGTFPGRPSKPTASALSTLRSAIAEMAGTDDAVSLGIAHDGDADRVVFADGDGQIIHEDTVVAILAHHYVAKSQAEDPVVVTTPNASTRIDQRVSAAGGRVRRVALGSLPEGMATDSSPDATNVVFAAEPWKHIHPDLGPWIDGVASAAVVARLVAARGLDTLREPIEERPARKASVDCPDHLKADVMTWIANALPGEYPEATISTEHGLRLTWDGEWVLVRPSGTEPVVRIYVESEAADDRLAAVREHVRAAIEAGR